MTGYGRAEGHGKTGTIVVELRSVNHRHCEIVARLPRALQPYEERLKGRMLDVIGRGRVELSITLNGDSSGGLQQLEVDRGLARRYLAVLKELQRDLGLAGTPDLSMLMTFRDIIKVTEQSVVEESAVPAICRTLDRALKALTDMRRREGRSLERDLTMRLREIEHRLDVIRHRLPQISKEQLSRLETRLHRLLDGTAGARERIDPVRLAQEVALLADRSDVSEEVTRLESHVQQFRAFLKKSRLVGRSLDFLLQEMNREVTTIGSKVGDLSVTQEIIALKAELEKIREQVQNVE